jgi:hypothetical protein
LSEVPAFVNSCTRIVPRTACFRSTRGFATRRFATRFTVRRFAAMHASRMK